MEKTLVKGINVLETLASHESPMSVSEVSKACDITRSNAHRLLTTLLELGYVTQDEITKRYRMTLRVWSLGSRIVDRLNFKREALPFLEKLNDATGETTHLSVLDDINVIYIDKLEAKHAVRTFTRIGGTAPAFCVATGKAMLAYQKERTIEEAIAHATQFTANTITDAATLREELKMTQQRGYAVNRGEWRGGAYGLAVPVFSASNEAIAAIGISAPTDRMSEDRVEGLANFLKTIGYELSLSLGATESVLQSRIGAMCSDEEHSSGTPNSVGAPARTV